ncbi:serine hydrolase domain-containing protein [Cohnella luojiensis]|uniref:Class C beta-lactamase-related serine hydrolase n=1 Tax=Cohnella luojiensis TaxID=652876 RepID=A0A4Y8LVB9_9BACL|nr:serine hydrolase [Cohnella luojiensis]TFE24859.1 class C beta-lactamase-related serine hydrolase [Cohnella luojiensis]
MSPNIQKSFLDIEQLSQQVSRTKIDYCEVIQSGQVLFTHTRNSHSKDKLHKINSVTKSVLSLLIGIAIDRGELENIEASISDYFPDVKQTLKQDVTIEHLLTMTPGWDWQEMGDWGGLPSPMINSPNWVNFILAQPMKYSPGKRMFYDSGCSHLLSAILQKVTGLKTAEYAEKYLFKPLGIEQYRWYSDAKGIVIGGFGLELKAPDLMKIGKLALGKGYLNGSRIVPERWIADSTNAHHHTYDHIGSYGYHWWIVASDDKPTSPACYFAMGYGGQYIFVVPEHELIAVFASTLYKHTFLPYRLFKELIYSRLIQAK